VLRDRLDNVWQGTLATTCSQTDGQVADAPLSLPDVGRIIELPVVSLGASSDAKSFRQFRALIAYSLVELAL
jgi:hypothetical protein